MRWWSERSRKAAPDPDPNSAAPEVQSESAAASGEQILESLRRHLAAVNQARATGHARFDPDLDLYESGYLDSLSASEFLLRAEQEYGVRLPDWLIGGKVSTLAALAAFIRDDLDRQRVGG